MAREMPKRNAVFIQSESELAAISMVFGASSAGARAMTSSSSPGISLKQEGISYIAAAELPCVIANIARGGPGLGNISGAQSDYFQSVRGGGHGDYRLIVLAPSSVQECYDLTIKAFDLADKYRNPVMILAEGYTGQMIEPLEVKEYQKPELPKKKWALIGCKGRKPNIIKTLYLQPPESLTEHNIRLQTKYTKIKNELSLYEELNLNDEEIVVIAYGISARVCKGAILKARKNGIKAGLLRPITLWPFPEKRIAELAKKAKKILVVEMSMGQMVDDVKLAANGKIGVEFYGFAGGWIPKADDVFEKLKNIAEEIR